MGVSDIVVRDDSFKSIRPDVPMGAYDAFLPRAQERSRAARRWEPSDGPLPTLFLSHGAPPLLDSPQWLQALLEWSLTIPKPHGIVIVSAHWENAPVAIGATDPQVPLYYDFGGFHRRYYQAEYWTPDSLPLAQEVAPMLAGPTGSVHQYVDRRLDHGAFIPLMAMYPLADVPVLQVSMPDLSPAANLKLGEELRPLREQGYLVIGSGFATHDMSTFQRDPSTWNDLPGYNRDFDGWLAGTLAAGAVDDLVDFRAKGPGNRGAHRTSDHYVPLLVAIGASTDAASGRTAFTGVNLGNSIRSIEFR